MAVNGAAQGALKFAGPSRTELIFQYFPNRGKSNEKIPALISKHENPVTFT